MKWVGGWVGWGEETLNLHLGVNLLGLLVQFAALFHWRKLFQIERLVRFSDGDGPVVWLPLFARLLFASFTRWLLGCLLREAAFFFLPAPLYVSDDRAIFSAKELCGFSSKTSFTCFCHAVGAFFFLDDFFRGAILFQKVWIRLSYRKSE